MRFQTPLRPGTLIRRWNRFLCEVTLDGGDVVRAHCPNPGAMLGLNSPGQRVWVEPNDDPRRKLGYGWRLVELPGGGWAGIDTAVPNRVVGEALRARAIPELAAYSAVRAEVGYGQRSRGDFLLTGRGLRDAYVEVKNVHLRREGDWAEFPDCVTTRGARHLDELGDMAAAGHRTVMLYLVQRTDCSRFRLARDLDHNYGSAFDRARRRGVEAICMDTAISPEGVELRRALPLAP
jgi:sugar fermentation stimulation protein A